MHLVRCYCLSGTPRPACHMGCLGCKGRQLRLHLTLFQVLLKEGLPPCRQTRAAETTWRAFERVQTECGAGWHTSSHVWAGAMGHAGRADRGPHLAHDSCMHVGCTQVRRSPTRAADVGSMLPDGPEGLHATPYHQAQGALAPCREAPLPTQMECAGDRCSGSSAAPTGRHSAQSSSAAHTARSSSRSPAPPAVADVCQARLMPVIQEISAACMASLPCIPTYPHSQLQLLLSRPQIPL